MSTNYTNFIEQDLENRLSRGESMPLTQRAIANHYGTSTRPVGEAIEQLIKKKVLKRLPNGRIEPDVIPPAPQNKSKTSALSSPADIQKNIENHLIEQSLKGEESFLREEQMAEKFSIGRTQLRSIFSTVAQSGLLQHVPRRGWRLRPFTEKDLNDFLAMRENLELMAFDLAKDNLEREKLEAFLAANQEPKDKNNPPLGETEFHKYIIERSGNAYIKQFIDQITPYYQIFFKWEAQDESMRKQTREQHRTILTHTIKGNWNKAKEALSHHIWNNHSFLKAHVEKLRSKEK